MRLAFRPLDRQNDLLKGFLNDLSEHTNANWTNHFGMGEDWAETAQHIVEATDHRLYVVVDRSFRGDEILAIGHLHNFCGNECYLGLAVRDDVQRKGIGSFMLEGLVAEATVMGMKALWLNVYVDNEPAIKLYEKHGFLHQGRVTSNVDKPRLIMVRWL